MDIRLATDGDVTAAPDWLVGIDLRADRWRDEATRAVVGTENGAVVAAGRLFTSRVHDDRYWVEVMVAPQFRRRGLGRSIAMFLSDLRADSKPLCSRGFVSSEAARFARGLGAHAYQTCPPERVRTADARRLISSPVATVAGTAVDLCELRAAWIDIYEWMHADWAPVAPGFAAHLLADFSDEVDLVHTRVVGGSRIRAAAFVFADEPEPVVVAECRERSEVDGLVLLRACVRDSLLSLAEDDIAAISFDGHDTDPHFRPLLDELPAGGEAFELLEWR
ncbi:GNAT family N-acetyltransferase [Allobranchiibius sp. CTAmp26]|uniref:GNAT family N-acetyltransferase n=1 Tax=Allobranchiibius sp. CTAmp26 TaxID=2815214 RepID=UPI001AA14DA1|nr:GNAT family N-acetyltransferase [Allobranchiibius sp. CTAmp26]MBO1755119.1 GNAT family N-acetyltransferase [Allobranchiibius sp. CTAmp26]